ncbi:lytic transglycosylase [Candidatus Williamhamiltonella defendens]|nr:transglycosylase SLT domain-containing protein [Candidatus Hamiltonella defensa]AYB49685.1 lytic transglycosylase [Candidatus Hamiltonella defensa]
MKIKTIFLAAVFLASCQSIKYQKQAEKPIQNSIDVSTEKTMVTRNVNQGLTVKKSEADFKSDTQNIQNVEQKNLWSFVKKHLNEPIEDNERIREQKEKLLKTKQHFYNLALNAEPYMYLIAEEIQKRNMPMKLVLLPIVESNFNPAAISSAKAAGLWQMLSSTAKYYGVKQNEWYDGRHDVLASTHAALDLMQNLNRKFNGDWLLTIAAYNCGEYCVLRQIKANKAQGKPTHFWALSLPRETSLYIPKMLALSDIIKNSEKYGVKLPISDENRGLIVVNLDHPMKLTQAAEMSGLPLSKFKLYNFGYKHSSTPLSGPHYFMVPQSHAQQFKIALKTKKKSMEDATLLANHKNDDMPSVFYKVAAGDTLSGIAQRMNIKIHDVKNWNQLEDLNFLKIGQVLQLKNELNYLNG